MKLAIVYDWIDKYGGAERILSLLFTYFPKADIYTLYFDKKKAQWAAGFANRIHTTFLQRLYSLGIPKQWLTPLMPFAIESLNLSQYDHVLSLSSSFAKGVITRPECLHGCYLFSPTRFLWHHSHCFFSSRNCFQPLVNFLRQWDKTVSQRPDRIFTLSGYDQKLIAKFYNRQSQVLPPPFDLDYWRNLKLAQPEITLPKQFFLVVSRLEPQKQIDLVIKAFKVLKQHNLVIVGQGTLKNKFQQLAGDNVYFLSDLSDAQLGWLYKNAQVLIMPQAEDFGYTALEAICFNTPVISYAKSGTAEFLDNVGYLFQEQTIAAIVTSVEKYHTKSYNFSKFNWDKYRKKRFLTTLKRNISLSIKT